MSEPIIIALYTTAGTIGGSLITAIIYAIANKKNNFYNALNNAANALNITTEELVESMLEAKKLRQEIKEKEREMDSLRSSYKTLKGITRKLYKTMEDRGIDPHLAENELELLFDTQPLTLLYEKEKVKHGNIPNSG